MRMDRLTTKSQQALQAALSDALRRGNPEIIPEHLLVAILEQEDGVGAPLVEKAGASAPVLKRQLQERLEKLPGFEPAPLRPEAA